MRNKILRICAHHRLIWAALVLACLAMPGRAEQITVFAAASLKNALDEVSAHFETRSGHSVTLSYAGSSALARQIAFGAPADVVISANSQWMDYLADLGAIKAESRVDLLGNRLVVISSAPRPIIEWGALALSDLLGRDFLAMALVQSVPAGIYGKAALEQSGQWQSVAEQVAQVDNVRAALALVALGEAPFGIVYATDARADERVHVVSTIPETAHPPIRYPAALVSDSAVAQDFLTYLQSTEARELFAAHGFVPLGD